MRAAIGNGYNIKLLHAGYPTVGQHSFTLVPSNMQVNLHTFTAYNTGLACDVGLGVAHATASWKLYTGAVQTAPTDSTAAIQAGTATSLFDTTNNHGFIVESTKPFGYVALTISQAQTGSPVYVYEYWNGSSWATLNAFQTPSYAGTGLTYLTFSPPPDWATGDGGLGANTGYAIRARASTAPSQAVQATAIRTARWLKYRQVLPTLGELKVSYELHPLLLDVSEALVAYFQTATATNCVEASYQQAP